MASNENFDLDPKFGKKARDKITDFEGIITSRVDFLYGCSRYGITPKATPDKAEDVQYFDEGRIEIIGEGIRPNDVRAPSGRSGPGPNPTHRNDLPK